MRAQLLRDLDRMPFNTVVFRTCRLPIALAGRAAAQDRRRDRPASRRDDGLASFDPWCGRRGRRPGRDVRRQQPTVLSDRNAVTALLTSRAMPPPDESLDAPHRPPEQAAYRQGFRDGFDEATERHEKAERKAEVDAGKDEDKEKGGDQADDRDGKDEEGDKKEGFKDRVHRHPVVTGVILLILIALIVGAIVFWRHSRHHETTDDAFIDGYTSQVAAQTGGRIVKLHVRDNQLVDAGDPLVDIDPRDNDARIAQARAQVETSQGQLTEALAQVGVRRAAVAEAQANARQSEADLTKAVQDLRRYQDVDPNAVARQQIDAAGTTERSARARRDAALMSVQSARAQVDAAQAQVKSARAQIDAARAQLATAELQGSYTRVVAPIRGHVARRTVDVGNVIASGQALMAVVSENLWVVANYKETQLTKMRPGLDVEVTVDAYPDVTFHGKVDSIQRASGAYFSMLPAENATGNYVKVVQRVPVKIVFDDGAFRNYSIGPGMSVTPDVTLP